MLARLPPGQHPPPAYFVGVFRPPQERRAEASANLTRNGAAAPLAYFAGCRNAA
jgi:hypothetical protein